MYSIYTQSKLGLYSSLFLHNLHIHNIYEYNYLDERLHPTLSYENKSICICKFNCIDLLYYHLLELATMTPLSIEKLSRGKPKMFQAWIFIGSPKVLLSENSCEHGIFFSCKMKRNK